jgi:hypothetical protein
MLYTPSLRMLAAFFALAAATAGEALPDGWYHLDLDGVLPGKGGTKVLQLDVVREAGVWQAPAWGYAPTFNVADHPGTLTALDDGALRVDLRVQPDPWVGGGPAALTLRLAASGAAVTGTWSGTALGRAGTGAVAGRVGPPRLRVVAPPLPRFTHPRLLFTAQDLPRLKAAAATPAGQAILARMRALLSEGEAKGYDYPNLAYAAGMGAACEGILYQLTGDPAHAARAYTLAVTASTSTTAQHETGGYASYILGNALAYDLCYQAWDDDQRLEIGRWLHGYAEAIARLHVFLTQAKVPVIKGGPNPGNSGFAIFRAAAGLAALAIHGDVGEFPDRPKAVPVADIAPLAGTDGEPIESDVLPRKWLWCGTFPLDGPSPLAASGGSLVPAAGGAPVAGGPAFAALASTLLIGGETPTGIDLLAAHGRALRTRSVLATVLVNDRPRTMQVRLGYTACEAWLAGRPVKDREIVRLTAGRYPLLIEAKVILEPPTGTLVIAPRLIDVPDPAQVQRDWQEGYDAFQASGRAWPRMDLALRIYERQLWKQADVLWGETGWDVGDINGGGHSWGLSASRVFAAALRRSLGRDATPGSPMVGIVQRLLVRGEQAAAEDAAITSLDAGEAPFARALIEGQAERMPIGRIPAALATLAAVFDAPAADMAALPTRITDTTRTSAAWRTDWSADAAVVQFTGNTGPSGSSRSAGDVVIGGFAAPKGFCGWSGRYELGDINYTPVRPDVNVVQISDAIVAGPARCVDSVDTATGGSRAISLDRWYPGTGGDVRFGDKPASKTDLGIRALRAVAVDAGGLSGAPVTIAIADRITGHGDRVLTWTWHTPITGTIRPDCFSLPGPDGRTLNATVVRPAGAVIRQERGKPLTITGGDGEFLVVITLQHGAAPAITATADGATIGRAVVTWQGDRLRIATP